MKTLKLLFAISVLALFTNSNLSGQVLHVDVVVNFYDYNFTTAAPILGVVSGSYTYEYAIKLNKEGEIESIHWVVKDCNLYNQDGDKIRCIDTGHDNLGIIWSFWNYPNLSNNDPSLIYNDLEGLDVDGWLDDYFPEVLPVEGSFVNMSYKMMVKGQKWTYWAGMVQLHMNAKGLITADVVNP